MSSRTFSRLFFSGISLVALTITASASAEPTARVAPSPWLASYGSDDTSANSVGLALAGEPDTGAPTAPATSAVSPTRVDALGYLGMVGGKGYAGVMTGATVLGHRGDIGYGGTFEYSGLFASRLAFAATGGWSKRYDGLGLDLLGSIGVHRYIGIGRDFLSSDPGVEATLPFAGVRGRVSYLTGRAGTRFQFGATLSYDRDLTSVTRSSTYRDGWLSWDPNGPQTTTVDHRIGYGTFGAMVDAGVHFD